MIISLMFKQTHMMKRGHYWIGGTLACSSATSRLLLLTFLFPKDVVPGSVIDPHWQEGGLEPCLRDSNEVSTMLPQRHIKLSKPDGGLEETETWPLALGALNWE